MGERTLKGRMRISRISSNVEDDYINITVTDDISGIQFFSAKISAADYADLITNREPECQYDLRGLENVGKTKESKYEDVFIPDSGHKTVKEVAENAVREYEKDGWKAMRLSDATNHHNFKGFGEIDGVKGRMQRILFSRFVGNGLSGTD